MKKALKPKLTPPLKILIVEDYEPLWFFIALWLAKAGGFDLQFESSGDGALKAYGNGGPYDIVLTDLVHPGPNGLELARVMRQENPKQAIAMLTGCTSGSELRSCQQLRIPVRAKPCVGEDLIRLLEMALAIQKKKAGKKTVKQRKGMRV